MEIIELEETALRGNNAQTLEHITEREIRQKDSRGYSLLMVAAEKGQNEVVDFLIEVGEDLDFEVNAETAASLAFSNGHHEIVLSLIKANAKYPSNYDHQTASNDLKTFVTLSNNMHEKVRNLDENDKENFEDVKGQIKNNCEQFQTVRHFFDSRNSSLLKVAIIHKMFKIYKVLLSLNLYLGSHESVDEIMRQLTEDEQRNLRNINEELSTNIFTDEMMILMRNCKLGPGVTDHGFYIEFIRKAFDFLFNIPSTSIILKIVAARQKFKIIFDFKRTSIQFLDPLTEPYTNGICYLSGKVFIAAMDMLDPDNAYKVYAVMAHELCHYGIFLTYNNLAKPYKKKNGNARRDFNQICIQSEVFKESDEIINSVYENYPEEMQHAELIVRVPQMMVKYFHDENGLSQLREIFSRLFNFYEDEVVTEMTLKLPIIKEKYSRHQKVKKLKLWNIFLLIALLVSLLLGIAGCFYFFEPTYTWSNLTKDQKNKFRETKAKFHGIDIKFHELFANDSKVYDELTNENIKFGLKGNTTQLSKIVNRIFREDIFLNYENLTTEMREVFMNRTIIFQGESIALKELNLTENILKLFSSDIIKDILDGLNVSLFNDIAFNQKFYVDRYLIEEDIEIDYSEHYIDDNIDVSHPEVKNYENILSEIDETKIFVLSDVEGAGKSSILKHFAYEEKKRNSKSLIAFVDLRNYRYGPRVNWNNELKFTNEKKISFIGEFVIRLLNLKEIEDEIFILFLQTGSIKFFWDEIDEMNSMIREETIHIIQSIRSITNCSQYISIRPNLANHFKVKFNCTAHKLLSWGKINALEFIAKYAASEIYHKIPTKVWIEYKAHQNIGLIAAPRYLRTGFNNEYSGIVEVINKIQKILQCERRSPPPLILEIIVKFHKKVENKTCSFIKVLYTELDRETEDLKFVKLKKKESTNGFHHNVDSSIGNEYADYEDYSNHNSDLEITSGQLINYYQALAIKYIFDNFLKNKEIDQLYDSWVNSLYYFCEPKVLMLDSGTFEIETVKDSIYATQEYQEFLVSKFLIEFLKTSKSLNTNENWHADHLNLTLSILNLVLFSGKIDGVKQFLYKYYEVKDETPMIYETLRELPEYSLTLENFLVNSSTLNFCKEKLINVDSDSAILNFINSLKNEINQKFLVRIDIKGSLLKISENNETILHQVLSNHKSSEFIEPLLTYMKENLNKSEISYLLFYQNNNEENSLMRASRFGNTKGLKDFWNFIDKTLNIFEKENILKMQDQNYYTALQHSTFNKNSDAFLFVSKIYESFFKSQEIQEILTKIQHEKLSFIANVIENSSYKTAQEVSVYLEILFKNNKLKLRSILIHRNIDGDSIYSFYKDKKHYERKLEVFINLLKKTFITHQDKEFRMLLNELQGGRPFIFDGNSGHYMETPIFSLFIAYFVLIFQAIVI